MSQPELPFTLQPGELLLRWSVTTFANRAAIVARRARLSVLLSAIGSVFLAGTLIVCAGSFDANMAGIAMFACGLPTLALGVCVPLGIVVLTSAPKPWWVTTRRLIVQQGDTLLQIPLAEYESLDLDGPYTAIVKAAGQKHRLRPVVAIPEMWGALLMGRALCHVDLPAVDEVRSEPTVSGVVPWHATAKRGTTTATGVLILWPDAVAWLPATTIDLGDRLSDAASKLAGALVGMRVTTVRPIPPMDALFFRLLRVHDPSTFRPAVEAVIAHWGGFVLPGGEGLTTTAGHQGDTVKLVVRETTYTATSIAHPDWEQVRAGLGV